MFHGHLHSGDPLQQILSCYITMFKPYWNTRMFSSCRVESWDPRKGIIYSTSLPSIMFVVPLFLNNFSSDCLPCFFYDKILMWMSATTTCGKAPSLPIAHSSYFLICGLFHETSADFEGLNNHQELQPSGCCSCI